MQRKRILILISYLALLTTAAIIGSQDTHLEKTHHHTPPEYYENLFQAETELTYWNAERQLTEHLEEAGVINSAPIFQILERTAEDPWQTAQNHTHETLLVTYGENLEPQEGYRTEETFKQNKILLTFSSLSGLLCIGTAGAAILWRK